MKQNFIELISVPFNAGESKLFAISGQYFELIDATDPIDVLLSDVNGAQRGVMRSAEASFNLKDTDFATVQLYSATAQTIRFAYGTGEAGTRRAAGAVSIVGDVGLSPATLAALESIDLNAATITSLLRPELPTGTWASSAAMVANTAVNIFTAAANVNGAILLDASAKETSAANATMSIVAKATAPANCADGQILLIGGPSYFSGSSTYQNLVLPQSIRIAPGLGLFYITDQATTGFRGARYVLL